MNASPVPVVVKMQGRHLTREEWRYLWRAARIAWRKSEPTCDKMIKALVERGHCDCVISP